MTFLTLVCHNYKTPMLKYKIITDTNISIVQNAISFHINGSEGWRLHGSLSTSALSNNDIQYSQAIVID